MVLPPVEGKPPEGHDVDEDAGAPPVDHVTVGAAAQHFRGHVLQSAAHVALHALAGLDSRGKTKVRELEGKSVRDLLRFGLI